MFIHQTNLSYIRVAWAEFKKSEEEYFVKGSNNFLGTFLRGGGIKSLKNRNLGEVREI